MMVLRMLSLDSTSRPSRASRSSSFSLLAEADLIASGVGVAVLAGKVDSRNSCPVHVCEMIHSGISARKGGGGAGLIYLHRKLGGVDTTVNRKNWKTGTQSIVKDFCIEMSRSDERCR